MTTRTLIVCPGRGSYGRDELSCLGGRSPAAAELIAACDEFRRRHGRPTISELDAAAHFSAQLHLAGEHASLLTFAASLSDLAELPGDAHEIVGVIGNSLGFYTALVAAGALTLADGIRLVDTMGAYQRDHVIGGQLVYPTIDTEWRVDHARLAQVDAAIASATRAGHPTYWSIRLGSHAVVGASDEGLRHVTGELEPIALHGRDYPLRLPLHSAFHTPWMAEVSARAARELGDLGFASPRVPLIDGRGRIHRPRWADPDELRDYTLGAQVTTTFDFRLALETALFHCAPEQIVALGPGNSLGAAIAHGIVDLEWRGAESRARFKDLTARGDGHAPLITLGTASRRR